MELHEFSFLREKAPWLPLVRALLGKDCVCVHSGVMLSMPGSKTQFWHQDGPHLNRNRLVHLPPHAINIFVPLVDLTARNGPTEFIPTTHYNSMWDTETIEPMSLYPSAGEVIAFDYRIKHRGLGNCSPAPRPVIYITYAIPGFIDEANFSNRRYRMTLPMLPSQESRRKRALKRKADVNSNADGDDNDNGSSDNETSDVDDTKPVAKRVKVTCPAPRPRGRPRKSASASTTTTAASVVASDKESGPGQRTILTRNDLHA